MEGILKDISSILIELEEMNAAIRQMKKGVCDFSDMYDILNELELSSNRVEVIEKEIAKI